MAIVRIQVNNNSLTEGADRGYLNADIAAASGTITVTSINKFAINQILLIGELGTEKSEIIKTHASTAPTGNTVTLASNTVYDHSANTAVYIINYDQYEISHATTETGSKTLLTTTAGSGIISIDPEVEDTAYADTEFSTGFYFIRKKETVGNTFSGYSDPIPAAGYSASSVGYLIEQALRNNNTELSDTVTQQDCTRWINEGIRFMQGKQIQFPQHQNLNAIIGQAQRGIRETALPSDIYENDTNKSIAGVRIGGGEKLAWLDPEEFEERLSNTKETQVRTEASATDTSLALDNSYDFADSGTVTVYVSGVKYDLTYTGVTRDDATGATAALTGIPASGTGSITVTIPVDTNVWQDEQEGAPSVYTVRNGNMEIHPMVDASEDNANIYMDYFTVATEVNSDNDTLDVQRFELIQDYLSWQIRMRVKNDGQLDLSDGYYVQFKEKLNDIIRTTKSTFTSKMSPKVNSIRYSGRGVKKGYRSQEN